MSECAGGKLGSEEMPTCVFKWDITVYEDICASNETLFWGQMFSNEISRFMRTSVRLRQPQMRHYQGTYVFKWDINLYEDLRTWTSTSNETLWGHVLHVLVYEDTCVPSFQMRYYSCWGHNMRPTKKPHSNEIKQSLLRHLWVCNWYPRGIYQQI